MRSEDYFDIPFNTTRLEGQELAHITEAITQSQTSAGGPYSRKASRLLREALGAEDVVLTTSCTDALEMVALLLDIGPGDSVIVPSFTFPSTALAFARQGARILFADVEPRTLGIDPNHVAHLLDASVKAVVPVHYGGIAGEIADLEDVVQGGPGGADIIEDNAHGLFGSYRDKPLGTFGRFSTLSFHETKNFSCGEGGALVVNRASDVDRAHLLLDKGTDRRAFELGRVDKYQWVDTGSSFGLSDILAAYLLAQLEERDAIMKIRREVFELYYELLAPRASEFGYVLPYLSPDREPSWHLFHVLLADKEARDRVIKRMNDDSVQVLFHYVPLHRSPAGRRFAARETECPVTDDISGRLLRLPMHTALRDDEIGRVVEAFFAALS